MMDMNKSLADVYVEYQESLTPDEAGEKTWHDFFDYAGVRMENRSDFVVAAILNQLVERGQITYSLQGGG